MFRFNAMIDNFYNNYTRYQLNVFRMNVNENIVHIHEIHQVAKLFKVKTTTRLLKLTSIKFFQDRNIVHTFGDTLSLLRNSGLRL